MAREYQLWSPARIAPAAILVLSVGVAACSGSIADLFAGPDYTVTPIPPSGQPTPVRVGSTLVFNAIATGYHHTCGLQAGGRIWCWGSNEHGQLGSNAPMQRCAGDQFACSGAPVAVEGGQSFVRVAASILHTCAIDTAQQAWCWGFGLGGQLGDGRRENSTLPVAVAGGHRFVAITASGAGYVTCALTSGGEAWCWGADTDGMLGNGTSTGSTVPVRAANALSVTSISIGQRHACAVSTSGEAWCWGLNWFGNLGVGSAGGEGGLTRSTTPVRVTGGLSFSQIAAGGEHTCALTTTGQAHCWGLGSLTGTVGAGSYVSSPVAVDGGQEYVEISTGFAQTCARTAAGELDCWGENLAGNLGNGTFIDSAQPVPVLSPDTMAQVAAGGSHTCALTVAGVPWCWGGNPWGGVGQPPDDP